MKTKTEPAADETWFRAGRHAGRDSKSIRADLMAEGWSPALIHDPAGHVYPSHHHAAAKLLVFLDGEMDVTTGGATHHCVAGDELLIPGNVEHAARSGPAGALYYWSEQLR